MSANEPPGCPQDEPFVQDCEAGKQAYCRCGASGRFPLCDGTHRGREDGITPLKVVFDTPRRVAWCACRRSGRTPYCDGSHAGD